jgi:hypothetical protein
MEILIGNNHIIALKKYIIVFIFNVNHISIKVSFYSALIDKRFFSGLILSDYANQN